MSKDVGRSFQDGLSQAEPEVSALRASIPSAAALDQIIGHLGAAIAQSIPTDDPIIMEHVRAAREWARVLRRAA